MFTPPLRHRAGVIFVMAIVGNLVLVSAQVNTRSGVPILASVTFAALSEVQRGAAAVVGGVERVWSGYVDLRRARRENAELRRRLAALETRYQQERATARQAEALRELLVLRKRTPLTTVAAELIAGPAMPGFRAVTINKGARDGLRPDMAVIAGAGVVGRVVTVAERAAQVQLLVDRNAAAGAVVERSRAQGVVVGTETGELTLEYVSDAADLQAGDVVVTSGLDGIYPKGFRIGIISGVHRQGTTLRQIRVRPAVDFAALEEVLVVLAPEAPGVEGRE